jgi:adenosylcobyric acid synthase
MKILFVGTSSGAGKTTIAAMFCRYLNRNGVRAAPFKASNLSSNAHITKDGSMIGKGQAFQALLSGLEPSADMNPILIRPSPSGMRTIVNGVPAERRYGTEELVKIATDAFDRLASGYEAVVCEGSGSPAELNLMERDIANMRLAREREIPVVLVGDIERGGVFAGIYGTWKLIGGKDRGLMKGFMINRFRGDPSILRKGTDRITELTGMRFLGVMPLLDVGFPEEDRLSKNGRDDDDIRQVMEMDGFLDIAEDVLDLKELRRIAEG